MDSLTIRKAAESDIDRIMPLFESARQFMRSQGNMTQWTNGYPSRETVLADIKAGNCYAGVNSQGEIDLVFAFIIGNDPTYNIIEDGEWPNDNPYGTIHRIASSGRSGGMLAACVGFCLEHIGTIRLDTHADNHSMRRAAESLGFARCGIIYCQDGIPRIAYQLN